MRKCHASLGDPAIVPRATKSQHQSEYGDIYKVTLSYEGEAVTELKIKYFDTIPPCTSITVLKTGFLFAASEYGNHALYQFVVRLCKPAWRQRGVIGGVSPGGLYGRCTRASVGHLETSLSSPLF